MSEAPRIGSYLGIPRKYRMLLHVAGKLQQMRPVCFEYSGIIRAFVRGKYMFIPDNCWSCKMGAPKGCVLDLSLIWQGWIVIQNSAKYGKNIMPRLCPMGRYQIDFPIRIKHYPLFPVINPVNFPGASIINDTPSDWVVQRWELFINRWACP